MTPHGQNDASVAKFVPQPLESKRQRRRFRGFGISSVVEYLYHSPVIPTCSTNERSRPIPQAKAPLPTAPEGAAYETSNWAFGQKRRLVGHRGGIRGRSLGALERQKFLTVNRHITRCLDTQTNLAPVDVNDRDTDIITDINLLA